MTWKSKKKRKPTKLDQYSIINKFKAEGKDNRAYFK